MTPPRVAKHKIVSPIYVLRNQRGDITVQDIRDTTPEEIKNGRPSGGNLPPLQ